MEVYETTTDSEPLYSTKANCSTIANTVQWEEYGTYHNFFQEPKIALTKDLV